MQNKSQLIRDLAAVEGTQDDPSWQGFQTAAEAYDALEKLGPDLAEEGRQILADGLRSARDQVINLAEQKRLEGLRAQYDQESAEIAAQYPMGGLRAEKLTDLSAKYRRQGLEVW